jgi:DNA-binding transcriptional regulator YdaS (Cro superfamily)
MQLSQWLKRANLSQKHFARTIGVSPACISRLVKGGLQPSARLIGLIEDATRGDVAFADWKKRLAQKQNEGVDGAA